MRVGIDGRYAQGNLTGVGKYVKNLVDGLAARDNIEYVILKSGPAHGKENIDLYHATANWGMPFLHSCPVITTIHDIIPARLPGYFKESRFPVVSKLLYYLKIQTSLWFSTKIIFTSDIEVRETASRFFLDRSKVEIIPMAVDDRFFKERKISIKKPYILNHGGIDQRKNIKRLIEAFSLTKKLDLIITGHNPKMLKDLKALANKLKISERVKFVGWVSERKVATLVRNAKCVVYPTLAEGFGMPILEAMAAGVPVVASNIPILKKLGKGIPISVNPNSVESIYKGIIKAISGIPKSRLSRGKAIAKNYTWDKVVKETTEVYFKVINGL